MFGLFFSGEWDAIDNEFVVGRLRVGEIAAVNAMLWGEGLLGDYDLPGQGKGRSTAVVIDRLKRSARA